MNTNLNEAKALPCPRCGYEGVEIVGDRRHGFGIQCKNAACLIKFGVNYNSAGGPSHDFASKEDLILFWNTRAPQPKATQHSGDCTIYRALINGRCFDGVCTCGYGWSLMPDWSQMLSDERIAADQPKAMEGDRIESLEKVNQELALEIGRLKEKLTTAFNKKVAQ